MTTPKHLYATFDGLAQFCLKIEISAYDPETFVQLKNRINCFDPDPSGREAVFFLLGDFDDETMELHPLTSPQRIGDLKASFSKLDAIKLKAEQQAKGEANA